MMKKAIFALCGFAGVVAAGPLGAQIPPAGTAIESARPAVTPSAPAPRAGTVDANGSGGRISETAPAPRADTGEARFRADLASCKTLEPDSQASCRQEMYAARAQGLYRN